jgi:hypothetical protein
MMRKLHSALQASANERTIGAAIFIYAMFAAILNVGGADLERRAGGPVLDLRQFFTAEEAYAVLTAYGEEGRSLYLKLELVDLVYPIAYSVLFALILSYLLKRALPAESALQRLSLLPFAALGMDYFENAGLITMCATYPERWPRLGAAAGIFNAGKWLLVASCLLLIMGGVIGWTVRSLRGSPLKP